VCDSFPSVRTGKWGGVGGGRRLVVVVVIFFCQQTPFLLRIYGCPL
jgi:hypothetical protein